MAGVMPVLGGSDASVTAFAQGMPSKVAEQPVTAMIPLPMVAQTGLLTVLMALTVAGAT